MSTALTQAQVRELFDYHPDGWLVWRADRGVNKTAGKRAGFKQQRYYRVQLAGRKYLEHALIYLWHHGTCPAQIDHVDRRPGNNRIDNLRAVTAAQNAQNATKRRRATSRWKGVSYQASKGWWRAYVQADLRKIYLGHFRDEADAGQAYNFAAAHLHGPYAALNEAPQTCPLVQ